MKNYRNRITAILLCVLLLIWDCGVFADADALDSAAAYQLEMLNRLGLVDETADAINMTEPVSRLDFAVAVSRVFGVITDPNGNVPESGFDDMADYSAEEVYAVQLLADRGLVSGTGPKTFSPDEVILQEQAAKILVCTLGYGFVAEEEGGYPSGYVSRAARLGLTDGFSFDGGQPLNRGALISMLYHALFADVMQPVYYADEIKYTVVSGENMLSNIMHLERVRAAMVTATDQTSMTGQDGVREGYVEIGAVLYRDNGEAAQYLGKLVDVYYKRNRDGSRDIIHVALSYDQESLRLKIDEDLKIDGNVITYYAAAGDRKTVRLAAESMMIYNGEIMAYDPSLIDTAGGQGSLVLQHSGDRGAYDLVAVEQYTNVIVKSVNAEKNIIYDLRGGSLDLDAFVDRGKCTIIKDGEEMDVEDLQKDQILTVYQTASGDRVTIAVRNDIVTGTAEHLGADKVKISGTEYEFDPVLRADLEKNLGRVAAAYLTADAKVIWLDWQEAAGMQYGYLLKGSMQGDFSPVLSLRLLTEKDTIEGYEAAKKVTLKFQDGTETKTADMNAVATALQNGGEWKKQLIRYQLNDEGKIAVLCIADTAKPLPLGKNDADFYCSVPNTGTKYIYRAQNKTVAGRFSIASDTPIFFVPTDDSDDDELYRCGSHTSLGSEARLYAAYNMSGGGLAGAVVCWRNLSDSVSESSPMMLIDDTAAGIDKEGNAIERLYGYVNGTYTEYETAEPILENQIGRPLRRGDLIAVSRDKGGAVIRVRLRVDVTKRLSDNPKMNTMNEKNWGKKDYWGFSGAVYSVEDGHAIISRDIKPYLGDIFEEDDLAAAVYALPLTGNIVIYDEKSDAVTTGSVDDIVSYREAGEDATRAYFGLTYTAITNMYIYQFCD